MEYNSVNELSAEFISLNSAFIDAQIRRYLLQIGVLPNLKGFKLIGAAVNLWMGKPDLFFMSMGDTYVTLGESFGLKHTSVERNIRHAINQAYFNGKLRNLNKICKVDVFDGLEKPTNSEVICLLVEAIYWDLVDNNTHAEAIGM
ncbi:MAG: sporulation initiation factor Spo0A C-terminal domain-containing protein [Bacillota bacterium]